MVRPDFIEYLVSGYVLSPRKSHGRWEETRERIVGRQEVTTKMRELCCNTGLSVVLASWLSTDTNRKESYI